MEDTIETICEATRLDRVDVRNILHRLGIKSIGSDSQQGGGPPMLLYPPMTWLQVIKYNRKRIADHAASFNIQEQRRRARNRAYCARKRQATA